MLEIKVTVETPGLSEAISALASAIANRHASFNGQNGFTEEKVEEAIRQPDVVVVPLSQTTEQSSAAGQIPVAEPAKPEAPTQPVAEQRKYTLEELSNAGALLCERGKIQDVIQLLTNLGCQTVMQVKPEQYATLAEGLKTLGAKF